MIQTMPGWPAHTHGEDMRFVTVFCSAMLLAGSAVAATPPKFNVVILPVQEGTGGINDRGQILQWHYVGLGRQAAILTGNQQTVLGTLGGRDSSGFDINNLGQVVGTSTNASEETRAFLYSNGTMRDLGSFGGNYTSAHRITDNGTVLGYSRTASGASHGFIWTESGGLVDVGTLGGRDSSVSDIDANGRVLGRSQDATGTWYNFIYENGVMTKLETPSNRPVYSFEPDGGYSGGYSTNDFGGAVSYHIKDGVVSYPYDLGYIAGIDYARGYAMGGDTWSSNTGRLALLNGETYGLDEIASEDGWQVLYSVDGMNSLGQFVGMGCRADSDECFDVRLDPLSPVPEPATYAMLGAGLAMVGWARRRKGRAQD
ncbi:PEP-CTERM sorting domain-containing protein [Massilia sp. METH4]|uniref:PEP-CTERM sorting domain-containing protein n=1 Tax=Massilia sp. METH4 TaxID=3123041 RepID=UPI0030D0205F